MSGRTLAAAAALLLTLTCGCDDGRVDTVPVSGVVVFADGEPVRTGTIEFQSREHGTTSSSRIGQEGEFTLGTYDVGDGAPAGEHDVIVVQLVIDDGTIDHVVDHGRGVPPKYRGYDTSPLRTAVAEEGDDGLRIVLQ